MKLFIFTVSVYCFNMQFLAPLYTLDKIQSSPYFKRDHGRHYIGHLGEDINVEIDVLASQNAKYMLLKRTGKMNKLVHDVTRNIFVRRLDSGGSCHKFIASEIVVVQFRNISEHDYGNYSLVATNGYGQNVFLFEIISDSEG